MLDFVAVDHRCMQLKNFYFIKGNGSPKPGEKTDKAEKAESEA